MSGIEFEVLEGEEVRAAVGEAAAIHPPFVAESARPSREPAADRSSTSGLRRGS
jgi:hypothetical protein